MIIKSTLFEKYSLILVAILYLPLWIADEIPRSIQHHMVLNHGSTPFVAPWQNCLGSKKVPKALQNGQKVNCSKFLKVIYLLNFLLTD